MRLVSDMTLRMRLREVALRRGRDFSLGRVLELYRRFLRSL